MPEDVTLDDVARTSGVSRATASRALNGRDGVRSDVRQRVELVADALGYRPNRAAKNLAGGRASVIGLVIGNDELRTDPYAGALIQAVARSADLHDEGLMLILDSGEPSRAVQRLVGDGLVDGVIISAVAVGDRWVEELLDAQLPTVLVGAHPRRSDVNVIDVENRRSSARMVGRLLDSGCRRVGTITGPLDRVDATRRLEGYHDAHRERGLKVDHNLIVHGDFSRAVGYELSDRLLDRPVDGVFCANDEMALGLLRRATERGLTSPQDLSVAGFDGTSDVESSGHLLTTVEQPFVELGSTAVQALISYIEGTTPERYLLLEPTIRVGRTTRPADQQVSVGAADPGEGPRTGP